MSNPTKIVCTNDQVFPLRETDAEQVISMVSALGRAGAVVTLLVPRKWRTGGVTAEQLARYYGVDETFSVSTLKSSFPSRRAVEKVGHALYCPRATAFKEADVLYTRNLPSVLAALRFSDKPVLYETYRPWPYQVKLMKPVLRWMVARRRFLGAVMHSRYAGQSFERIGLPDDKLLVAHNGYEPEHMKPVLDKKEAREKLGLPQIKRIVTYAGHVNMEKGLGILLELANRLEKTCFVIAGSYGRGEVEKLAEVLPNVRLVSWRPFVEVVPYLYASDVLFIPPTRGPLEKVGNTVLPIKTFLYMAAGRAILGPSTPDLLEVLENGRNAVLVAPDNLGAAGEALAALLNDEERLRSLGARAALDVEPMTWENRAARVLGFIEERLAAQS